MDWAQIGVILGVNGALFGGVIALLIWMRTESRNDYRHIHEIVSQDRRDILNILREIKDEMKDFHGKLERQDAEFKGKMALQDAEFKAHILHYHKQ